MKCHIPAPVVGGVGTGEVARVEHWSVLEGIYKPQALINISVLEFGVRQVSR